MARSQVKEEDYSLETRGFFEEAGRILPLSVFTYVSYFKQKGPLREITNS